MCLFFSLHHAFTDLAIKCSVIFNVCDFVLKSDLGVNRSSDGAGYNFQCRGVLLIWIKLGQGPTMLAVGAGLVVLLFSLSKLFLFITIFLRDSLIKTEILSQKDIKPKLSTQAISNLDTTLTVVADRARGYKTVFMLNSIEHEIFPAHKC